MAKANQKLILALETLQEFADRRNEVDRLIDEVNQRHLSDLTAEIARLRKALEEIAKHSATCGQDACLTDCVDIAREALAANTAPKGAERVGK